MARPPAYYQTIYPYYLGRRIAARPLYRAISGIVLHELGEVRTIAEAFSNRLDVGAKAICRNLRAVDDPLPNVIDEGASRGFGALAGDE